MAAVFPDPQSLTEAHTRIVGIRSRQALAGIKTVQRDWIFVASRDADPTTMRAREIIRRIATEHGVSYGEIMGFRRSNGIMRARLAAYYAVAIAFPEWSFPRIGRVFGRDHTTIMNGIRKVEREALERSSTSPASAEMVEAA